MKDMRKALRSHSRLCVGSSREVEIVDELGRGASCIVYDAIYRDAIGVEHKVRVKECYPNYLLISRNALGELLAFDGEEAQFQAAKERFVNSYRKNNEIRNTLSLTNSTMNSTDIMEANHTTYILMAMDEGSDYRKYEDHSLKELLLHMKSLSALISKYHEKGYLHLDIKPENVFILPETKEHILLFDFDTVTTQEELLANGRFRLSFSEGFSAPEQVQGKIKKIGTCTDVYSIGALLFYKLFGRKPEADDCRIFGSYDFSSMNYADESYQPRLYPTLADFLKKTLSISVVARMHDMQQVMAYLDELILLSDVENMYLLNSFQYNSACFVGRKEELEEISEILNENQLVFLSGIGGIGKTELAKQYANAFHGQYDSVSFAVYHQSLEQLVCEEISIHKLDREEDETEESYFERKIEALKRIATEKDLIIIDNFDVEAEEQLERLLSCPCKFIFTTRKDYRDYNFQQLAIDKIRSMDEIKELFYAYNNIDYDEEEKASVEELIKIVDHHTMTVELLAKYLRSTEESPIALVSKFKEREGITNTDETGVRQRKDRKLRLESVNRHLSILFDVFGFQRDEQEIISSLSLLAGIKIQKNKFVALCSVDKIEQRLDLLIKNGWVEYNENTDKISLHQVLQDLIYTKLRPDANNCRTIVHGMYQYVTEEASNSFERRMRERVFDIFMGRIDGSSLPYAKLCLEYGKEDKLQKAESICKDLATPEAYDILQRVYRKRIKRECQCSDMFETSLDMEEYGARKLLFIAELAKKAIAACKLASGETEYLIKEFVSLADEMDWALQDNAMTIHFGDTVELDQVYQIIISLYEWAAEQLPNAKLALSEKEKLYMKIQKFYSDEDMFTFTAMYRQEHYGDLEKAYHYQSILDEIREESDSTSYDLAIADENGVKKFWHSSVSCLDMAEQCRKEKKYEEAIAFYKKAYEEEDEPYEMMMQFISRAYLEMGDYEQAIQYLETVLGNPDNFVRYPNQICLELIKILIERKDYIRARAYAHELLHCNEGNLDEQDTAYAVTSMLAAYYYLYLMEQGAEEKNSIWNACIELFKKLGKNTIEEELYDFIYEYLRLAKVGYEEILEIAERTTQWGKTDAQEKILSEAIQAYKDKKDFAKYHILMLFKLAEILNEYPYERSKEAFKLCEEAQELYAQNAFHDPCLQSRIYHMKAEVMWRDGDYEYKQIEEIQRKCDYWLMAKEQCEGCEEETQIEIWNEAADNYRRLDDYQNELKCLERSYSLMVPIRKQQDKEYGKFNSTLWKVMQKQIRAKINLHAYMECEQILLELYQYTMEHIMEHKSIDHRWDFYCKLNELSEQFQEIDKKLASLKCCLLALYVLTAKVFSDAWLKQDLKGSDGMDSLCAAILQQLDDVDTKLIDQVIAAKDELMQYETACEESWALVQAIIDKIMELYQKQEIEFKQ